jgi:hypothetical protein
MHNLCPWSSETESAETLLEHFFQEFTNIYLSRDTNSVSELYGQRLYLTVFLSVLISRCAKKNSDDTQKQSVAN